MSNIVEADFQVIQERTLPVIATEILQIEENVGRVALDGAIRIGQRLKEAKEKVEHGQWENWCRDNLNYSKSKTEKLMKIAAEYGDENSLYAKTYTCTDLSISKALRLLQVPEEEVETFAENHNVEDMTIKELEKEIKELKVKNEEKEAENTNLLSKIGEFEKQEVDSKRISELETKLEKQAKQNQKLNEKLQKEKAEKDREVQEALAEEKEKAKAEAESAAADKIREAEKKSDELLEKIEQLEKKAENASNENILLFKLKVDQLQEVYADCESAADASSEPEKLKAALKNMMKALIGE